jgi:sulfur-carrier protein
VALHRAALATDSFAGDGYLKVYVPGPLRSYTKGKAEVEGDGESLRELLADLDSRFPGMRFRMIDEHDGIRQHIRFFVNADLNPNRLKVQTK